MRYLFFLSFTFLLALTSCTSSKSATTDQQQATKMNDDLNRSSNSVEVDAMSGLDLTSHLRKIPGMQVQGSGPNAIIRVRDQRSSLAETSPLFVVNGNILGNNFSALYSSIDPNEIARIRVLKSASETNRYGLQGGNGVVEIKLKK